MEATTNYGLSKSEQEEETAGFSIDALPRAVLRRNAYILLDGEWHFALDLQDVGLQENWHLGHHYEEFAHWPGSVEDRMKSLNVADPQRPDQVVVWYEREFPLPVQENHSSKSMIQLTFGACGYETRIWLNGCPLKTIEDELVHQGEYTSFSYELDSTILQASNRLTVRIADTLNADIPRGKQESHIYKRGGIWYQTYSGPVRSIWLETIERNRLRSRIGVVSIVEDRLVRFNLTLHIHDPGTYTVRLEVYPEPKADVPLASDNFTMNLEAGERVQRLVLDIPGAKLWSIEMPQLYRLVAKLIDHEGYTAVIETDFGLRKIESRGRKVYLNHKPVYLDGILYQPGASSYEQIRKHMYAIKKLGCNLIRIHIAGVDPRIYKMADRLGLLLWVEVPSPHRSSEASRLNHHKELLRMLSLLETHPSIVIWSLYNEAWGAQDVATNKETRQYIIDLYNFMRINHPQFLVVDNDGWLHVSHEGRLKSDMLTAHVYTPDFEKWQQLLDRIVNGELEGVTDERLVIGDPFFYRHQLPIIISEWGGFGFIEYGGPADPGRKEELIARYKKELRSRPIAGDVYTQAVSIEEEHNGLIESTTGDLLVREMLLNSQEKEF
jgi:beta-galactosidase/beta-glucuronidase